MRTQPSFSRSLWVAIAVVLLAPKLASAQAGVAARITQAIDESRLTTLRGNTHPLARSGFDRGAAPATLPARRMLLVLRRSAEQESALETLMEQQQDASSPNFHKWLTPQQFGQQFGPSDQDIQTITSWLQSHGFQVAGVSNGRTVIEFSGTAGQLQEAFHTTIHRYSVNGEEHWANSSDPQIPEALAPVVAGINTLYNFPRQQMHELVGVFSRTKATRAVKPVGPLFTFPAPGGCGVTGLPNCYALDPADFAKIYNVPNLLLSPAPMTQFNGDGVTIAVVGESDINTADVAQFRALFGLPALTAQQLKVIVNGADPGVNGAETEADLDIQLAGAVAPHATIDFVIAEPTEVSLGVDLAAQYAVDNNLAAVLNESFGICEFFMGTADNTFYNQLWQQGAAQGTTVTVSSGDGGSAVCDQNAGTVPAQFGLSVSGFTSTPYNVSVGGTDFNDLNNVSPFWNTTPSDTPTVASARGYIPEMTWNDSCTNQEIFPFFAGVSTAEQSCNNATVQADGFIDVTGGSGGTSACTTSDFNPTTATGMLSSCSGGYAKPSWQAALDPGSKRDVPDVSLFASNGFNASFYLICESDMAPAGASCDPNAAVSDAVGIGGTSASSPAFAGIMALVNQATVSRQGNANYILYKLAGLAGNTCTSAANPASTCVLYDVPSGSTIAMPCKSGKPNCNVTTAGDSIGVLSGYATSSSYDRATGLGSVNAGNLISKWKNFALTASTTTLILTPPAGGSLSNLTHGQSVSVSSTVTGAGGTPSGNLSLIANTGTSGTEGVQGFILNSSGVASGSTTSLPGGSYTVFAQYAGDGTFASSKSSTTAVTVNPEAAKVQFAYELFDPVTGLQTNPNALMATFGTPAVLRVNVTSATGDACPNNAPGDSGCPTGSVAVTDSYNGGAAASLDGGSFALNALGYTEDQAVDLAGGTHKLSAIYGGDGSYTATPAASPATDTLTINAVSTTTSSPVTSSAIFGASANISATMSAQIGFSNIAPTGTITFAVNGTTLGSSSISACGVNTTSQKTACANVNTSSLPHGQDSITATYNGDFSYAKSVSLPENISVLYATTTTVASSNGSVPKGTMVTFTAQAMTTQPSPPAFAGTVQFLSDSVSLGVPVNVSGTGQAQLSTSSLSGGTHTITAQYSGDTNFASSSGSTSQTVVLINTTTSVSSSNSTITQGANVTFTATITPASAGPALAGTVQFTSNGANIGSPANVSMNGANGQASVSTTTLPQGSDQIVATYSGDSNYNGSASSAITETVNPAPTFTISANPTTVNISAPGQSGSTTLTFTSQNGFTSNGSVMITPSCTGLPSEASCSSGQSVTITSGGSTTATVTFSTMAPSAVVPTFRERPATFGKWTATGTAALTFFLAIAMLLGYGRKQLRWAVALILIACGLATVAAGCGGGGSGGGGGVRNPGTPTGTTTPNVSVTINSVTQSVGITLNVQ